MTNDNNVKCALHPTREHPSRACTPRGFTAQFDKEPIEEAMLRKNKINALLKQVFSIPNVTVLSCAIYDPDLSMDTFNKLLYRSFGNDNN